ncbi:hypothetical protein GP486_004707 [Trichoglossum hirsutum]|uniref:Uncharacterized protein n=1 Tax=Trichoglossum hirsutum TaxID=265104 RepID=A0A9P8LAM6_9PEZI|nr:hypothetical protein GP486_004707 [Trichoglossum hirsutum]
MALPNQVEAASSDDGSIKPPQNEQSEPKMKHNFIHLVRLSSDSLQQVLEDLKCHDEFAYQDEREGLIIHPVSFLGCLLKTFSGQDDKVLYEKAKKLMQLESQISTEPISGLGGVSIELNRLRSDLPKLRTFADFAFSLTKDLEDAVVVSRDDFVLKLADFPTDDTEWEHLNDSLCRTKDDLRKVRKYCQSRKLDIECMQHSIEMDFSVISNLTALSNIEWNKRVAQATRHDSSAMKVVAVLGLVFLPGTFISEWKELKDEEKGSTWRRLFQRKKLADEERVGRCQSSCGVSVVPRQVGVRGCGAGELKQD